MTLKIVHYMPRIRLADGGIVRAVLDWCSVLAARGHRVTLLTFDAPDVPRAWVEAAGTIPGLPTPVIVRDPRLFGNWFDPHARQAFDDAVRAADVLHLHAPWLPGNVLLSSVAGRHRVPYVVTVHGMLDDWPMRQRGLKKRLYLALRGRRFLRGATVVHTTAAGELEQARKWLGDAPAVVLPYLFDTAPYRALPGAGMAERELGLPPRDLPRVLFLSRLHEKKGVDRLILAAAELRRRGVPHVLMIAGTGDPAYEAELRALAQAHGLTEHVRFLGLVTGQLKVSLYEAADVFVLPTHAENFGLVLPEALACGTPVVTTKGVDIWPELLAGGARLCTPDPASIADVTAPLLADRAAAGDLGRRGRQWVLDFLDPERLAGEYERLYAYLADAPRRDRQIDAPA